ncbi:hypothetical protein LIP_1040 [Limnochorda pilosa]|uniref:Uncharacterized protein n=2 Tax=Limnochorda pilosa TaxID=1555112 RepID=A0A0K2SIP5_LIMPI|nr:hypothetical protein LIP_1040 [Limnochorda pilosa]
MDATAWRVLAGMELRARWNRSWRFSPFRSGVWVLLAEVGLLAVLLWKGKTITLPYADLSPFSFVVVQAALWGMARDFLREREELFARPHSALVHLSPAQPASVIVGQTLADIPEKMWEQLLATVAVVMLFPVEGGPWQAGLLWAVGVTAGSLGGLSGLMAVILWTRWAPRVVAAATVVVAGSVVGAGVYAAYLAASGFPDASVLAALRRPQGWLPATLVAVLAPGSLLAGGLLLHPGWIGRLLSDTWLSSREAMARDGRRRRPRWPSPLRGAVGAIHASGWLQVARNPFSLMRLGFWIIGLLALVRFMPGLAHALPLGRELLGTSLGVGLAFVVGGEVAAAVFDADGPTAAWYRVAGARPAGILWGKLWVAAPLAATAALNAWVVVSVAGAGAEEQLRAAMTAGGLGLGTTLVMVGVAAAGARFTGGQEDTEDDLMSAALEQVPRSATSWLALLAGVAYAVLGSWCLASRGSDKMLATTALLFLPVVAVGLGGMVLRRKLP